MSTVGIVGLGLIGGSLARDLAAEGWTVQAADRRDAVLDAATAAGVVSAPLDPSTPELVVLAVPVRAVPAWLRRLAPALRPDAVVTDVGSTKASTMAAAEIIGLGPRFVGSHPMAGDHRSGWDAGRAGLFREADVWICRGAAEAGAVERVAALWTSVGGLPRAIDAADHDRLVAWASHLPQLVATALAGVLAHERVDRDHLGPGGRDTTRLAGSDPALWVDILCDNGAAVAPGVDAMIGWLVSARGALETGDEKALRELFEAGRRWSGG
ncbi:MAG: prephenate dehydrogenase/arogenate dehydrogenase family protein [Gemmatimonadota bacterium]|jgi:prephenate dehydrogenase